MSLPRILPPPASRRRGTPPTARPSDGGFTLVETLVAMLVLLVGVLGTAMLMITALEVGRTTRTREAATNLAREIVESARSIHYDQVISGAAGPALRALGGLADVDPATTGWQVERRGVRYTVTVDACIYDDPKDGRTTGTAVGYCPSPAVTVPATASSAPVAADPNGDDYRKVSVRVSSDGLSVPLTATVVNPTGGFGPRITGLTSVPAADAGGVVRVSGTTDAVQVSVHTAAAASLNWDAGDTRHGGALASTVGATSWSVDWSLGTPPAATADVCDVPVTWTPDAPAYLATFQPFDRSGLPGDLRTQIVAVDRSRPFRVCDAAGGRNPRFGAPGVGVVDLQWRASSEGDVVSYRVSRVGTDGAETDVCPAAETTECVDASPPADGAAIEYRVRARQRGFAHGTDEGPAAALEVPAAPDSPPAGPAAPGDVVVRTDATNPRPVVTWTASADPDVAFYRVYRDGVEVGNRYGRVTADTSSLSFIDRDPGGTAHTYYVAAVDKTFAESAAAVAVESAP